jgi:hypothetical protein
VTGRQATLAHEAGHVVGGLLVGHRIETVRLGPTEREPKSRGMTTFDWAGSPEVDMYGHLVAVLMGPMAAGNQPPAWPPLPDTDGNNDEHVVLTLVSHLKLTKPQYMAAVALASHWIDDPLVKAAIAKVAHALGQTRSLTDAQVRDVLGAGLVEWLELAAPPRQGEMCST